jgi:hypothetical protein
MALPRSTDKVAGEDFLQVAPSVRGVKLECLQTSETSLLHAQRELEYFSVIIASSRFHSKGIAAYPLLWDFLVVIFGYASVFDLYRQLRHLEKARKPLLFSSSSRACHLVEIMLQAL